MFTVALWADESKSQYTQNDSVYYIGTLLRMPHMLNYLSLCHYYIMEPSALVKDVCRAGVL